MTEPHLVDVAGMDDGDHLHVNDTMALPMSMDLASASGPVDVDVDFHRTAAGFELKGEASVDLTMQCHRCLTPIETRLAVAIDDLVTSDPDDGQPTVEHDRIDLVPIARDAVGLAIPLRPVCTPDCQGLCPVCGSDLNSDPCGGHDEVTQNPFAVLEHLLDPE